MQLTLLNQVVYVSATPSRYEMDQAQGIVAEQIIRPTGLVDPEVEIRPVKGQMEDLSQRVPGRVARGGERAAMTILTKRMAEDLTEYCCNMGVKALSAFGHRDPGASSDYPGPAYGRVRCAGGH